MSLQPAGEPAIKPAIVEFDDEGNARLHLPAAGRRRFLVDESPGGTFHLVPLLGDDELPALLHARMVANEADANRLVRHPRHPWVSCTSTKTPTLPSPGSNATRAHRSMSSANG